MARRFVRVDLSDTGRDFRPIAVEPGVPLLDYSNANSKIIFRWLGGLSAEPEWEGESVSFYVREDHGGRVEDVLCQSASDEDLQGLLKADLETLRERLSKAKAETSTERAVYKVLNQNLTKLLDDPHRTDRDNYFFRYKDVQGRSRLVWCWGYQRVDQVPAPTLICTDPDCSLLFVRRPGQSAKCPSCEALHVPRVVKRRRPKRRTLIGLLLFLLGGLLAWWLLNRNDLVVRPDNLTGLAGSRIEYSVIRPGLLGLFDRDVTQRVVAVSADPRIVRLDPGGAGATAGHPGRTFIHVFDGQRSATALVTVKPAEEPTKVYCQPNPLDLGIGTTARLTLYGDRLSKVKEGVKVDPKDPQFVKEPDGSYWTRDWSKRELNDGAEWRAHNDGIVYHFEGLVEGLKEGKTNFTAARYPLSKGKPLEAPVAATVQKIEFTRLEPGIDPLPVLLGQGSKLRIDAVSKAGKKYSVLESSRLALRVDPPNLAKLYGTLIEGRLAGKGKLVATFRQAAGKPLSSTLNFEVAPGGIDRLLVSPEQIEMVVGEIADLTVLSPYSAPIKITSTKPDVVEVTKENRLVGRAEGAAKIEVVQGKEIREVAVNVAAAKILSLALKPSAVSVPVGQTAPVRALGTIEGDRVVELAPDFLKLDKKPAAQYAEVDPATLAVRGVSPTTAPEQLALSYEALKAAAPVEVVRGLGEGPSGPERRPSNVSIVSDQGPSVTFPKGAEFDDFRVEVSYPDGMKRIVTKKATLRASGDSADAPVAFKGGRMIGIHAGKTEVTAEFEGVGSEQPLAVEVAEKVDVDEIRLRPSPLTLLPKDTVTVEAVGYKNKKSVGVIGGLAGVTWKSEKPEIARVQGPELTAQKLGDTQVTAAYGPLASKPLDVHVVNSLADALIVDPRMLPMHVGESRQLGTDLSVSRANVDFSREVQVSSSAPGVVQFQPEGRTLKALKEGSATVTFSLGDKLVSTEVTVLPAGALDGTLVVEPAEGTLAAGQALPLRAFLIGRDGQRLDLTDVAQWSSSLADKVFLRGNQACALAAGQAEITARLPNAETAGKARVTVTGDPITELVADPPQLALTTGETAHLRIEGRAACGTHELFPQDKLKLAAEGVNPSSIQIAPPQEVHAVSPGSAQVAVRWADKLGQQVPVTVGDNVWTDLTLTPSAATIHPEQAFDYQVIGKRGGVVQVVDPDQVKLSASNPDVAHLAGMRVVAGAPGTSEITARVGGQELKANLAVAIGEEAPRIVGGPAGGVAVFGPGGGFWRDGIWHGGVGGVDGGFVAGPGGVVADKPIAALFIDPAQTGVRLGQSTPRFHARAQDLAGNQTEVPASLESMNDKVLTPDLAPGHEGQFLAVGQGHTQVRARYADHEANAEVTVGGDRFANVESSVAPDSTDHDFAVDLNIAAGAGEGPLEYRAYQVGQPPPQGWVASQVQGDAQHAVFQSPRLPKGPPSTFYDLMIESRNPADGSIQQYPFRFRVGLTIEKSTDTIPPAPPPAGPAAPPAGPAAPPAGPAAPPAGPAAPPAGPAAPPAGPAAPPAAAPATPADDTPFGTEPPQKKE